MHYSGENCPFAVKEVTTFTAWQKDVTAMWIKYSRKSSEVCNCPAKRGRKRSGGIGCFAASRLVSWARRGRNGSKWNGRCRGFSVLPWHVEDESDDILLLKGVSWERGRKLLCLKRYAAMPLRNAEVEDENNAVRRDAARSSFYASAKCEVL